MDKENSTLARLIDDSDHSESLPKVLLIAGGAIVILFIVCFVIASMTKTPSISHIEMPERSSLAKPPGEVAGANTQNAQMYGPEKPPPTTPTGKPTESPTASPTSAPTVNSSPTSTPTPTSKPADPTNTPTPTPTDTPTPTAEPTATPTP